MLTHFNKNRRANNLKGAGATALPFAASRCIANASGEVRNSLAGRHPSVDSFADFFKRFAEYPFMEWLFSKYDARFAILFSLGNRALF
jgi:hypothetical protein